MADWVRAIHLVAADGTERWIEPSVGRITEPERLARAHRGITREHIHYDDDMFSAALVSLGTLGVIVSLVLEVRQQFGVHEVAHPLTNWVELRRKLLDGSLFGDGMVEPPWLDAHPVPSRGRRVAKSLSVFINPYRSSGDYSSGDGHTERSVLLVTCAEASEEVGPARDACSDLEASDRQPFITDFKAARSLRDTAAAVQRGFALVCPSDGASGYKVAWSVLETTSTSCPLVPSLEIVVSTAQNRHVALLDELLARFDAILREKWAAGSAQNVIGAFTLRFTRPTRALLGMQAGSGAQNERFCHIEIPIYRESDSAHPGQRALGHQSDLVLKAWREVIERFGARLHWGQYGVEHARQAAAYPKCERFLNVLDRLTQNGTLHAFDSAFSVRAGLIRAAPGWTIRSGMVPAPPPTQAPLLTMEEAQTAPTLMMNGLTGCNEVFVITGDNQLARCRQLRPNGRWSSWELLPSEPRFIGRPAAVTDENTTYVFARTVDGQLFQTNSPGGKWHLGEQELGALSRSPSRGVSGSDRRRASRLALRVRALRGRAHSLRDVGASSHATRALR